MHNGPLNQIIGKKVIHFDKIGSTNDYASLLISKKDPEEGTVISADYQTLGKGQYGRKWVSNKDLNITLSVILKPTFLKIKHQFHLNAFVSLALIDLLEEISMQKCYIKWPNDIYIRDQKIAGILIQNFIQNQRIHHTVVGLGINVNQKTFPQDIPRAVSIALILGQTVNLNVVRSRLYRVLDKYYYLLQTDYSNLFHQYQIRIYGRNKENKFLWKGKRILGEIIGTDPRGYLEIRIDGKIKIFAHGDIKMIME